MRGAKRAVWLCHTSDSQQCRAPKADEPNAHVISERALKDNTPVVASPGDAAKPMQTGQPNTPATAPKTTRVVRAAEFSSQPYLETESEVDAYLARLKSELLAVVRAGQKARIQ